MILDAKRYTSGRIAVANLSASIDSLEGLRAEDESFQDLVGLSDLLFVRGDLLGRIADHDRAELIGLEASAVSPKEGNALYLRARLAARFHRFSDAAGLLDQAAQAGHEPREIEAEMAVLFQATGRYGDALILREALAKSNPGIQTLGALATALAEMGGEWSEAEHHYASALEADRGVSPIPCAQLLFEWGVNAMRRGELDRAETIFGELTVILPAHVPGQGHCAEVALARGELDRALELITPLLQIADDPEYRATYAEILAVLGQGEAAAIEADRSAAEYERLLARRPEAYADHAAAFFMGIGNRPHRAVELARANWELRDTPRSRGLLQKALQNANQVSAAYGGVA